MQFSSILLALSTVALVHAGVEMYDTCLSEFSTLVSTTGAEPRYLGSTLPGSGQCMGCDFKAISNAYPFEAASPSRPVVARSAYKEQFKRCSRAATY